MTTTKEPWSRQHRFEKGHKGGGFGDRLTGGVNSEYDGALFSDTDPKYVLTREQPVHRRMIELSIQGLTNREIAANMGYSEAHVGTVLQQPFARQRIVQQLQRTTMQELKAFLEAEVMPNVRVLKELRDSSDDARVRKDCANDLLDRFLGKPKQSITTEAKPVQDLSNEELAAEVKAILAQENERTAEAETRRVPTPPTGSNEP